MSEINNTPESIDEGIPEVTFTLQVAETVQAPVDPTLSIEGQAADAQATGEAIADLKTLLEGEIDTVDDRVDGLLGTAFPVGTILLTESSTAPSIGTGWTWQEVMIPVTQGDLINGARSYQAKGTGDTPGTIHFWRRTA